MSVNNLRKIGCIMSNIFRNTAIAAGLSFLLAACSTTPAESTAQSETPQENNLLGKRNPETGCFEQKETGLNGEEKITNIICPF